MADNKILGMIGLAKRAGKIVTGLPMSQDSIKARKSRLIIIASDSSDNSKKAMIDSCEYYKVPYIEFGTKDELGNYSGGGEKSVVSVNDKNFAKAIKEKIDASKRG